MLWIDSRKLTHRVRGDSVVREQLIIKPWVIVALGAVFTTSCVVNTTPDAGSLDAVYANPSEQLQLLSLGPDQTLGLLLGGVLSANDQADLIVAFQEYANPRRMPAGTELVFHYLKDDQWLRSLDVVVNPDETVRLTRNDLGWESELVRTPTYLDTLSASGEIESVLWSAVVNNEDLGGVPFEDRNSLIDELDQVFQWQVDFSRQIRVGDTYRFAFEREVRPDGSMRTGRLLSAELVNSGTPYHAIWFDPNDDGEGSYFDLEGNSVRRAFLLKPLAYRRISSRYSNSRLHPILRTWRAHRGVDYAADAGAEVMATSDGVVIHRAWKGSFGNTVEIQHPNGFVTRYAHLSAFRSDVKLGSRVRQSEIIGYVGMPGQATGNHLHYEMMKRNGEHMDPLAVDLPAGDPVPSDDQARWGEELMMRVNLLESIPGTEPILGTDSLQSTGDEKGGAL